jgi:hypothetical protein
VGRLPGFGCRLGALPLRDLFGATRRVATGLFGARSRASLAVAAKAEPRHDHEHGEAAEQPLVNCVHEQVTRCSEWPEHRRERARNEGHGRSAGPAALALRNISHASHAGAPAVDATPVRWRRLKRRTTEAATSSRPPGPLHGTRHGSPTPPHAYSLNSVARMNINIA